MGDEICITEMSKCEGEARANNRKAKLIFFYEWDIEFKWKTKKEKVSMNIQQIFWRTGVIFFKRSRMAD